MVTRRKDSVLRLLGFTLRLTSHSLVLLSAVTLPFGPLTPSFAAPATGSHSSSSSGSSPIRISQPTNTPAPALTISTSASSSSSSTSPSSTSTSSPATCSMDSHPTEQQVEASMPRKLRRAVQRAEARHKNSDCRLTNDASGCQGKDATLRSKLLDLVSGSQTGADSHFEIDESFDISLSERRRTSTNSTVSIYDPQFPMVAAGNAIAAAPAGRTVTLNIYSDSSRCIPCVKTELALWEGLGRDRNELLNLMRNGQHHEASALLHEALKEAFAKKGVELVLNYDSNSSPSGSIPHMVMDTQVVSASDIVAALNQLEEAPEPSDDSAKGPGPDSFSGPDSSQPQIPHTPGIDGECDRMKSEWGCFCLYSPPGGPYNESGEKRFADACLNAMGDPKQPERWNKWYNCKEIKTFQMVKGPNGTEYPGLKEWVAQQHKQTPPVNCFRGYMYSHSNGYQEFVNDRTKPISECIQVAGGVKCFSLHDCGCSTGAAPKHICNRAVAIQKELANAKSDMVVHFDVAKEDQALPGGLHRLDKEKMCAANPDGFVVDEYYWRRVAITSEEIGIYRHKKIGNGWEWVVLSPTEFQAYCRGQIK